LKVVRHSETLLQTIHLHYEPTLEDYMKQKTRGDNNVVDSPWNDVRHGLGRLLSYFIAIKVLITARKYWPQLFVDFEVTAITSSQPQIDPPDIRRTASGIIQRMSRSKEIADAYKSHAKHLQAFKLDDLIKERAKPTRFQPIVHAEVNLLASVLASQDEAEREGEDPLRFFNEAEFGCYIGSSKPTCLLCHAYFLAHPSKVACRESHGNLYVNWRAPDVFEEDGPAAAKERCDILEAMVKEVRSETTRAIRDRSYTRRKHDSWDTPTNPLRSTTVGGSLGWGGEEDELASQFGKANLDSRRSVRSGLDMASVRSGLDMASVRSGGRRPAKARSIDMSSTLGQVNDDMSSMRAWSEEGSRETTPTARDIIEEDEQGSRKTTPKARKIIEKEEEESRKTTPKARKIIEEDEEEDDEEEDDEDDEDDEDGEDGGGVKL
jgi:hypothetical protein